jgi:hypothetical protein
MPPIRGPEEAQIISSSVRKAWTKPKLAALLCLVGILIAALYTMFGVSESSASFPVQNRDTGRIVGWRSISYRASLRMTDMSRCRYPTRQHLTGSLAELAKAAFIDVRQQHAARATKPSHQGNTTRKRAGATPRRMTRVARSTPCSLASDSDILTSSRCG